MIAHTPGAGLFTHAIKPHIRRGLTWHVSQRTNYAVVAVMGRGSRGYWERRFMCPVDGLGSVPKTIDHLYFTQAWLVVRDEQTRPVDDVPWEIHDIVDPVAYEAAIASYKAAMALVQ